MNYRHRVSAVIVMSIVCLTSSAIAKDAKQPLLDELSFFDYLGTLVEDDGRWIDPLDLLDNSPEADVDVTIVDEERVSSPGAVETKSMKPHEVSP